MKVRKAEIQSLKKIQQMIGGKLEEVEEKKFDSLWYKVREKPYNTVLFNEERSVVGLALCNNQISDLSPLKELKNLTLIELSKNQITDLSPLKELKNLTQIDLSQNQITDLSPLKELKNLTQIDLSHNQITDLSPLKELKNLTYIDLENNQIKELPEEILALKLEIKWEYFSEDGISLVDNPLDNPPIEVIKQGNKAIKAYFESLKEKEFPLNEIKVLLVGDGGAGKTSLIKNMLGKSFDPHESKTHGIAIQDWPVTIGGKEIIVHFWDFGGQEIMHSTHQFFLSKRSLYILVLDDRKEENEEYWLKMIESFGGTSPILIALNKIDDNPSFDVNRKFLRKKFKGIKNFVRISCKTSQGIDALIEQLKQHILDVEIIQTLWPEKWFKVKQTLEKMEKNYISFEMFQQICQHHEIKDSSHQDVLLAFLHDLGVVVHFSDIELFDTSVLNPEWVTQAVYQIINSDQMAETKGLLDYEALNQILTETICPRHKHQYIVSLMEKFELCYKIDSQTALLPDLLDKQEPDFDFNEEKSLQFILDYDFMPKSIMPQFIVKMHHDIHNKRLQWRTGVVLENQSFAATAVIKADMKDEKVYIYITGKQKRDYLAIIRDTLNKIHKKFEKMTFTERIPLPEYEHCSVEYSDLIGHEMENKKELFVGKIRQTFDVQYLLNRIESKEIRIKRDKTHERYHEILPPKDIKIFLASSKELADERDAIDLLVSEMDRLYRNRGIRFELVKWEDKNQSFNATRKQDDFNEEMLQCDIVIVLFGKRIGAFTKEEYNRAFASLKNGHKPDHLFVYFKTFHYTDVPEADLKKITDFRKEIDSKGQFSKNYKDIKALQHDFQKQLTIIVNNL
jgi:hypothetical protein